jgi:hypothetical protein
MSILIDRGNEIVVNLNKILPEVFQLFFDRLLFGSLKFCKANSIIECPVGNADIVGSSFLVGFGV